MIRLAVAAIVLLIASCAAAGTPKPNVRGVVVGGPVLACPPGEPCDPPAKAVFVVFARRDHAPVRTRIGPNGVFAAYLSPGRYAIRLLPPQSGRLSPSIVRVPATGITRLRLVVR